jgi:glycosyltransferase involved in cell wall biosynthesis
LKIWPEVKKAIPTAQLHIFYGWELFTRFYANNPASMGWKAKMDEMMKADGITDHGRVSQNKLKEWIEQCGIWAYPCVTGDTLIDMPRDYMKYPHGVPIKNLVGKKDLLTWTFNEGNGEFELKKIIATRKTRTNAKVIKINWTDGTNIKLTPDHRVLTYKRGWVKAKDLLLNESVVALKKHIQIQISIGKGYWPYEHREIARKIFGKIPHGYHVDHIDGNSFNNTPRNLQLLSPKEHGEKTFKDIFRTKQAIEKTTIGWQKWSNTEEGKKRLSENGKIRSHRFWDNLSLKARQEFINNRTEKTREKYKNWWLSLSTEEKNHWGDSGRQSRWNHKVKSIEECKNEDVYDMEVEDTHNFIAGGVVVHNCHFGEINCISAIKAQAWGAVPVVIDYAALETTVQHGVKVKGDIYELEVREKYKQALINLLKDPKKQEEIRQPMTVWARNTFKWENVAIEWSKEFRYDELDEAMEVITKKDPKSVIYLPVQLQQKHKIKETI